MSHAIWDMISNFCPYCSERDSLVLILDNGRYVNHSDEANSRWKNGVCVALRDIAPGEEILEDYHAYDKYCWPEPWDDFSEEVLNSVDSSLREAYAAAHPDDDFVATACTKLGCYVNQSVGEKGMALVLNTDVKAGEILWSEKDSVLRIPQAMWEVFSRSCISGSSLTQEFFKSVLTYGYYDTRTNSLLITLDNGRFKNHCLENPSGKTIRIDGYLHTIASRDLKAGTEIEEDYNAYDVCQWEGISFDWEKYVERYN